MKWKYDPMEERYDPMEWKYDPMEERYDPMEWKYDPMEHGYDPMECKGRLDCIFVQNAPPYFRVKIANFSSFFCPSIPKRDLDTKKTTPNIDILPESLGAFLEY